AAALAVRVSAAEPSRPQDGPSWRTVFGAGTESRVQSPAPTGSGDSVCLAYTDVRVAEKAPVQFLGAGSAALRIWINGRPVYRRDGARPFQPDSEHFDAVLGKGANRVVVWT